MRLHAENRFTVTKSLFFEGMLRVSRDTYGKFAAKCMLLFAAVWAALFIFTLITGGSMIHVLFSLGVVVLIGLWICVWAPPQPREESLEGPAAALRRNHEADHQVLRRSSGNHR